MSSEGSSEETSNGMARLNVRSDSDEAEEQQAADIGAEAEPEAHIESPQNMQTSSGIAYSRTRRALTFVCRDEEPSTSQSRSAESSASERYTFHS